MSATTATSYQSIGTARGRSTGEPFSEASMAYSRPVALGQQGSRNGKPADEQRVVRVLLNQVVRTLLEAEACFRDQSDPGGPGEEARDVPVMLYPQPAPAQYEVAVQRLHGGVRWVRVVAVVEVGKLHAFRGMGAVVHDRTLEGVVEVVGGHDQDPSGAQVRGGRGDGRPQVGFAEHKADGVVDENGCELLTETHVSHVAHVVGDRGVQ